MKRLAMLLALLMLVGAVLPATAAATKRAEGTESRGRAARSVGAATFSQDRAGLERPKVVCEYLGPDGRPRRSFSFGSVAEAEAAVSRILRATGVTRSVIDIEESSDVKTVAISGIDGNHHLYIYYNGADINNIVNEAGTQRAADFIMLHEIGHFHYGHPFEDDGSNPQETKQIHYRQELEADWYAGFILRRMKAPLDEAQAAVRVYQDEAGSSTHPPKAERLDAIRRGWEASDREIRDLADAAGIRTPVPSTTPIAPRGGPQSAPSDVPRPSAPPAAGETQISVLNTSRLLRQNWWAWTAYLDAPPDVLNQVDCVDYQLHPTFRPPSVRVCERGAGEPFALRAKGWGFFTMRVRVYMKDGRTYDLQHRLILQ